MSIFSAIGNLFSDEGKSLSQLASDVTKAPSFGRFWNSFQSADPLMHGLIDDQATLDDRITGKVLGGVGLTGPAKYFNSSADDPTKSAEHHALLGLAWLGGEAALGAGAGAGAGAGGAAGGGTAMGGSAGTLGAADSSAASADLGLSAADVGGTSGATAGAGSSAAGAGAGAGSSWLDYAKSAAKAVAPAVVNAALQPKPPKTKAPMAMPDPLAQEQAQRQKLIEQLARRGRASTVLTSATNGSLGG
jgi:hypothetical protein